MRRRPAADPGLPGPQEADRRYAQRVRRGYLLVSGFDYFADMLLTVTSVLLFRSFGMTSGTVFALVAAVWIVEGIAEIPTGILADMFGRRGSVTVSFVLRAVGYGALFFSNSVTVAACGTLLAALGGTFASGSLEAWAVDETGAKDPGGLDRLFAQGKIAENSGLVVGTLTGAALGTVDLGLPQLAAGSACALAAVAAALLMTGSRGEPAPSGGFVRRLRGSAGDVATGARLTVQGDRVLIALILGAALLWLFRGIPGVQWTVVYGALVGGNLIVLGLMRSVGSMLEIPLLAWTLRLQRRSTDARRTVIITAAACGAVALTVAALVRQPAVSILCYVGFSTAFGLCMPGVRAAMNERIDGRHRATVLSVASLFNSLFTGGGLIVVGTAVGDLGSVTLAWPLAAAGFCLVGLWVAALSTKAVSAPPPPAVVVPQPQDVASI